MTKRNGVISCSLFLLLTITFDNAAAKSAEVSAISLDVLRVKACAVGQGCSTVGGPKQWNLFDLAEGKTDFANQVLMPAKTHELRLMLGSKSTITVDGQTYPLTVPSGQVSGLKLKGNKVFASASGFLKSIRLNFDPAKGLVVQAKKVKGKGKKDKDTLVYSYSLKPVIQVSSAEVTPMPENMAAVLVRPNKSSSLTLGDRFSMVIPSGAISEPAFIFAEETKSSMISSVITLGPEGTTFSIPVQVQVKYYPEAIPGDYPESELVMLHDFREISTQIDMTEKKLSGEISHFSTVRGGVKEKIPVKIGKITYERRNDPPVHVIYFDKNANNYELRLISDMNPDRTINLQTISKISSDNKAIASINGFYWNGDEGTTEGKGTLATTTIMNDVLMNKYSGSEVLFGFGRNEQGLLLKRMTTDRTSGEQAEFEEEFRKEFGKNFDQAEIGDKNEKPTVDNIMHNLLGTTTTLMRDGECKGSGKDDWWSAIGYGKDKVVMMSSDPANYVTTSVKDTEFCDTLSNLGVTDAIRLDGGPSVGLYYKADNQIGNHVNPITSSSVKYKYGTARHIAYVIGLIESQYIPPPDDDGNGDDNAKSITIEENKAIRQGTDDYWHEQDVGHPLPNGGSSWTYNNDESHGVDNYRIYRFSDITPGKWKIKVFIPSNHANTKHACYEVKDGNHVIGAEIDQSPVYDDWVTLGVFKVDGNSLDVRLTDMTGESYGSKWVGFDAIKIVPASDDAEVGRASGVDSCEPRP